MALVELLTSRSCLSLFGTDVVVCHRFSSWHEQEQGPAVTAEGGERLRLARACLDIVLEQYVLVDDICFRYLYIDLICFSSAFYYQILSIYPFIQTQGLVDAVLCCGWR